MATTFDPWLTWVAAGEVALAQHASPARLAALQAERLAALREHAARASPLYARLHRGLHGAPLTALPVVRKADLMRRFGDWVTDPALTLAGLRRFIADPRCIGSAHLDRYTVWESSGSTGEPAVFVQDARAMAVHDAIDALRRPGLRPLQRWLDPWALGERLAFVGATGGHFASNVSIERWRRLQPALAHRLRGIDFLQPLPALCAALQAFGPTVLATYPSAAVMLARAQQAGHLRLRLHELWTGGEALTDGERAFVGEVFGCPVGHSYGASEFLTLAYACAHGRLHLNSDWAVLEPVDARGRPVPEGVTSHTTLLTHLANTVQPLIRYDLGDRVTRLAGPCGCGSALPAIAVEGRVDDTLWLADRQGRARVRALPLALCTVIEDAGLFDFQLVQQGPAALCLGTAARGAAAQRRLTAAQAGLRAYLERLGAPGVQVRTATGQAARGGRSGKTPRVLAMR